MAARLPGRKAAGHTPPCTNQGARGLFSMLVLMAIVTTLMASPIFEFVYGREARASGELGALGHQSH